MTKEEKLKLEAEKCLEYFVDSLPAWTEKRKEAVLKAILSFGENYKTILATIPCECKYSIKDKNYNRCSSCGGNWKNRINK